MVGTVSSLLFASVLALNSLAARAQTSLYIPGFDDQPLSVSEVGAGSDGRTTWAIVSGEVTGSVEDSFPATATLVEGPNDAVITYSFDGVAAQESCKFSGNLAICEAGGVQDGLTVTATETDTISDIVVAYATPTGLNSATSAPSASSGASQTASSTAASTNTSGGMRNLASCLTGITVTAVALCLL